MTCDSVTVLCDVMLNHNPRFQNRKQIKKKIKKKKEKRKKID